MIIIVLVGYSIRTIIGKTTKAYVASIIYKKYKVLWNIDYCNVYD